jgi:hypothetical protein
MGVVPHTKYKMWRFVTSTHHIEKEKMKTFEEKEWELCNATNIKTRCIKTQGLNEL